MANSLQIVEAKIQVFRRLEKATLGIYSNTTMHLLKMVLL